MERIFEIEVNNDGLFLCKEEGLKEIFFDSFFSELFNLDSLCIMNSGLFFLVLDDINMCLFVFIEFVGFSIVYMIDGFYE